MKIEGTIAILGTGNIGSSIAEGLLSSGEYKSEDIILTRRRRDLLKTYEQRGFPVTEDNLEAVEKAGVVILAVRPQQAETLLDQISGVLSRGEKILVSVVTDIAIADMRKYIPVNVPVIRVMPNTAIAVRQSMTCLCAEEAYKKELEKVRRIFEHLGRTVIIEEELMDSATVLAACGVAFFMRAIRAASQGGIQIGFHSDEALKIAAQTARGAAELLLSKGSHPESEIDNVTTPKGCTIAGLNEMEHQGFSSAIIKGIMASYEKAGSLHQG
ncbi:MAG: pyrroline-5-carboxylate reductase [Spirochaetales bacterium]|nr:pyrroline-5-carboxylate reductase [Spirochaetales bacterium]